MSTASIADIYDTIKNSNGEYCSICFRPASERKLVNPVFIIHLKSSIKYNRMEALKDKEFKVCYICEAMATRTVRFQQVVSLAASVEAMLTWMTDELRDAMVLQQFFPSKYVTQEMNRTIQRAKEVEAALQNTIVPQLTCSHVLIVGSDTPAAATTAAVPRLISTSPAGTNPAGTNPASTNLAGTNAAFTRPAGIRPAGNKPRGPRHSATNSRSLRQTNIHPIVIEDSPPPEREGGVEVSSCGAGQLQLQVLEQATGNVVLHPIIIGTNEKMYVPSLKVEVVNKEILRHVSDEDLFKYADIPIPPAPAKPAAKTPPPHNQTTHNKSTMIDNYYEFIKQQTEYKESKDDEVDPLGNTESTDTVSIKKVRLEERPPKILNGSNKQFADEEDVGSVLKPEKTYATNSKTYATNSKTYATNSKTYATNSKTYASNSATKRPVLRMDKVLDWEDKIPMDVISFMDATDPNPNERIMQPNLPTSPPPPTMGVISDVRTISGREEEVDNDVLLVENIECIDLC